MRFRRGLFCLLLVGACGGTSVAEVLGTGGAAANNVDGGGGVDATAQADGAQTSDGGDKKDGGGADAATPEAGPPKEAGLRPSDLSCPPTTNAACNMDSEKCCRMTATGAYTCIAAASPCVGVEIRCANAADCDYRFPGNGELCCAQLESGKISNVLCRAAFDCHYVQDRFVICDPNAPNPCPHGGKCVQSTESLPKFFFCDPS